MSATIKRVGRDFELLLDDVKNEYNKKGVRLSDTQASDYIAKNFWRMKIGVKNEPKKKLFTL